MQACDFSCTDFAIAEQGAEGYLDSPFGWPHRHRQQSVNSDQFQSGPKIPSAATKYKAFRTIPIALVSALGMGFLSTLCLRLQ
jgi:hypothetical protein